MGRSRRDQSTMQNALETSDRACARAALQEPTSNYACNSYPTTKYTQVGNQLQFGHEAYGHIHSENIT